MNDNLTLGQLIAALSKCKATALVEYDFCSLMPTTFACYAAEYSQLALGWTQGLATAGDLLQRCNMAVSGTFHGGSSEYTMDEDTPIWVDNPGCGTGTALVGVEDMDGLVILRTYGRGES